MPSRKLTVLSLSLFVALGVIGLRASAQSLTGEWKDSLVKDKSKVNLNFALRRETDGDKKWHQTIGHAFEFSELGLSREQVLNGGPASFRLAREAGTIEGEAREYPRRETLYGDRAERHDGARR